MAVFKCKMCGGTLEIGENQSIATCEFCGTQQTLPKVDDEKKIALFNRANNLRFKSEFDKAAGIYESLIAEYPEEAEAFWGLVLCKFGIEYVDDKDGRKVPTCHRTIPTSVMDDDDFQQACENADISAKSLYRDEAKAIDGIQKKILEIALTEEPYDIFICYKETDDLTGVRTEDSTIAQDVYTELIKEGYKVFFSRVTLRDKAGTEYEPYIYSALSSAKVMLVFGTKFEYFDAVWVKNEWSRYLSMMGTDKSKHFIACYKDLDAYDIPKEFRNLQALNIGEVTFIKSLFANIEGFISKSVKEPVVINNSRNATVDSLLKRAFMFLEDEEWDNANNYFEKILDIDPECGKAYIGLLMAQLCVKDIHDLVICEEPLENNPNYLKAIKYSSADLQVELQEYNQRIVSKNEQFRLKTMYEKASSLMLTAITENDFIEASELFKQLNDFQDSKILAEKCFIEWNERVSKAKNALEVLVDSLSANSPQNITNDQLEESKQIFLDFKYFSIVKSDAKVIQLLSENKYLFLDFLKSTSIMSHADIFSNLINNKKIQETILSYFPIMRFIISNQRLLDLLPLKLKLKIQIANSAKIFLGSYPQSDSSSKQPIEWVVLYKNDNYVLLLSRFCLDAKRFNSSKENYVVHWETSEIRAWLNTQFLNTAFNRDEQDVILNAQLPNPSGPGEYSRVGNNTIDRVFLLSYDEVTSMLSGSDLKFGYPTNYAINNGCNFNSRTKETGWWLRTSGDGVCSAYIAFGDEKQSFSNSTATLYAKMAGPSANNYSNLAYKVNGVRPAILVDMSI